MILIFDGLQRLREKKYKPSARIRGAACQWPLALVLQAAVSSFGWLLRCQPTDEGKGERGRKRWGFSVNEVTHTASEPW